MSIKLTIPGIPVSKGRPRVGKWGTYTPEKTVNYENLVKYCYMEQGQGKKLEGPLRMDVGFFFPIPKSVSNKKSLDMDKGVIKHTKKPDLDNCIKSIADSLNGMAYEDDSQIMTLTACKYYSSTPRAEVTITEVGDDRD